MFTIIWLIFTTIIGGILGKIYLIVKFPEVLTAVLIGALLGLIVGIILRFIPDTLSDVDFDWSD